MSFVHLSMLTFGGLFLTVPIALHLIMRQKPKHQLFPAIRFLQIRQTTNQRTLRLRQWLLLALRCLAVVILALALARPSVASAEISQWLVLGTLCMLLIILVAVSAAAIAYRRGVVLLIVLAVIALILVGLLIQSGMAVSRGEAPLLLGDRQAPVAAVLMIDASPTMLYRHQNQSSLERAQDIARWLIRQFPKDSDVAIVESRVGNAAFCVDLGAAVKTVDAVQVDFRPQRWQSLFQASIGLLRDSDKARKELYVLSDLTVNSWNDLNTNLVKDLLDESRDISVQIIDVGVNQPQNEAVVGLELQQQMVPTGSPINLQANIARVGSSGDVTVKLMVERENPTGPIIVDGQLELPEVVTRGEKSIELEPGTSQWVAFSVSSLAYGTHHGYVELTGKDGLEIDDRQYFTVHVRPPWPVLVAAPAKTETRFLTEALAPYFFRETGRARFECTVISLDDLPNRRLEDYAAVAVIDPAPLRDETWQKVNRYVQRGGGLAMFLGRNASSATQFNTQAASELMPANIQRVWRDKDGLWLAPREFNHPAIMGFNDIRSTVPWSSLPVFTHWVVGDLSPDSSVLIPFSNGKAAVLERLVDRGRVILMTTTVAESDAIVRQPWNQLPNREESWIFVMLMDQLFLHLVQSRDAPLNYQVGQLAQLNVPVQAAQRWPMMTPRGDWQEVASSGGEIRVTFVDYPGVYRLKADVSEEIPLGFSANLSPLATRLDRVTPERLSQQLGERRFRIARNKDQIVREIDQARIGREFYPFLLPVLVLILAIEQVMANRFYRN